MRRSNIRMAAAALAFSCGAITPAFAQTPATDAKGYAEATALSSFGNVTSQSYGGEIGYRVWSNVQLFIEGGQVRNVATSDISTAARTIAGALSQIQSGAVTYSVKQPVSFGVVGLRYGFAMPNARVTPYVLVGGGVAKVKNDVAFQLGGSNASLSQYVTLGSDLSGSQTKAMATGGAGVVWPAYKQLVVDFQFRYGRVFTDGGGINIGRAGIGLGVRF